VRASNPARRLGGALEIVTRDAERLLIVAGICATFGQRDDVIANGRDSDTTGSATEHTQRRPLE